MKSGTFFVGVLRDEFSAPSQWNRLGDFFPQFDFFFFFFFLILLPLHLISPKANLKNIFVSPYPTLFYQ